MNKTAEQLDGEVCAPDGLHRALTSSLMKINSAFITSVIILSYVYSYKALKTLLRQNIFSNCTRIILIVCSINSIIHQTTMMEIRIRQTTRSITRYDSPCGIQFHSSECIIELYLYYITNFFSTYSVFSLTFDRFISYKFPSFYLSKQTKIAVVLLFIQLCLALGTYCFGFLGVSYAGYVPMCTYPPRLAKNFDTINTFRTVIMVASIAITLIILYLSVKIERKIHQENYNTKTRYNAFENMTTSKSICVMIILQFVCIIISSFGVTIIRSFEYLIPQEIYHTIVPFLPGVTYANLCLPVVIYYTTKRTIRRRKNKIGEMTSTNGNVESHIKWLKETWN
uniref:G_PROTEIN_RECEP_F1_2 domain-containing protein n=1 Tax=Caenorhabditis tropicalis TaxID=1561998 RepID=A0A1I7TUY9_9PELO